MMKNKMQILTPAPFIKAIGMVILIVSCLLAANPVKALNKPAETAFNPGAALPAAATVIVDGGGQAAIDRAIKQARPGDTVLVKSGNYDDNDPQQEFKISASGTVQSPITLLGEDRPRLGNLEISDSNHFIVSGFEIAEQGSDQFLLGINIKDSQNLVIRDMRYADPSSDRQRY
jgi:hypothetical protein